MSLKDKFKNYFFLEEDDDSDDVIAPQKVSQQKQPVQQAVVQPIQQQVRPTRVVKERKVSTTASEVPAQQNVVNLQLAASNTQPSKVSKVILVEPRVYAEAQDIAEHLKNNRAVIVNLQRIDREQGFRIVDFLSGTIYAIGGDIQRVGKDIFLCAPDNVEVSGEITTYLTEDI